MESGRIHLPPIQDMLCRPLSFPPLPEKEHNPISYPQGPISPVSSTSSTHSSSYSSIYQNYPRQQRGGSTSASPPPPPQYQQQQRPYRQPSSAVVYNTNHNSHISNYSSDWVHQQQQISADNTQRHFIGYNNTAAATPAENMIAISSTIPLHNNSNKHHSRSFSLPNQHHSQQQQVRRLSASSPLLIHHRRTTSAEDIIKQQQHNTTIVLENNRYKCNQCQKTFSRPSSLRIHILSHTGEKPHVCPQPGCERRFSVQSNMRRHLKVHYCNPVISTVVAVIPSAAVAVNGHGGGQQYNLDRLQQQ